MSQKALWIFTPASKQGNKGFLTKQKKKKAQTSSFMRGLLFPAAILVIWELAGYLGVISQTLLPRPTDIFVSFIDLLTTGNLIYHFQVSLLRALGGFLIGGTLGLLAGLLVGFSSKTEQTLDPTMQMLRTIPTLAVIPLFILWFGFGEVSKLLLIAKGAFFPLYVNTFLGIRSVDTKMFEVAKVLEFSRWKQIKNLVLPSALPNILLGLRLALGAAWLALVAAELMGSSEGIGYLITDARQFSQTTVVFVGIIIFAVFGKASDSFVRFFERRLLKWRDSYKG
ncbi:MULTISPECIES: ABC transporter permease [Metabacillus]|uniref:ABC transporter permease n=1 Tax=Metabacillus hrfriensis TaxID=3048891 RepID=A0ACD4RFZ5_9BACI|nr:MULTISPECIES: ABC transporter permease [Metabacillus]UAL53690.1 ABC transporter permease [Metabacillus dongyingensis]USK30002.1 ABC transporter permease [Bacillus sp. CMF21]WHZ59244.1 ABC transporter permease [Metabacillus sp. CT-WN-B3]